MSVPAEVFFPNSLSDSDVRVSPTAQTKLAELLKEADADLKAIRVFVSGGGCSGMQYGMTFAEASSQYDSVLQGKDFSLYVDSVALAYLRGVEIDYVERDTGGSFVFNNVFAATGGSGSCGSGCGAKSGSGGGGGGCA